MLLGAYPVIGVVLLVIFLFGVSFQMHNFWTVQNPQMRMVDMINFTKNLALLGASLMFPIIPRPWPLGLGLG
jgi:uncharacterized membrane protein YphA (DoxX/SURF4 family)